ncbi:50S ribosomal protein L25 [Buchnera aphidicola (Eriosoma grossulariae)]|uniref:50S ribosomal protein L25 n=1 Tax=Buchnera aphidicola TaxID=9 RepID=UPI003463871C
MLKIDVLEKNRSGTNFSRNLRIKSKLPAIIYGNKQKNISIILDHDFIFNIHLQDQFYKNNLILMLNTMKYFVKVQSIHYHVFKPKLLHVDFILVDK